MAGEGIAAPVIVMTSYAEIRNAVRCMKLGARDYVAKPVNPDELLKKIREALDAPAAGEESAGSGRNAPRASRSAAAEPLNYIDIFSRIQLEQLVADFEGTMLFVEHDSAFCRAVATDTVNILRR